jgi:hypothetical protein
VASAQDVSGDGTEDIEEPVAKSVGRNRTRGGAATGCCTTSGSDWLAPMRCAKSCAVLRTDLGIRDRDGDDKSCQKMADLNCFGNAVIVTDSNRKGANRVELKERGKYEKNRSAHNSGMKMFHLRWVPH